MKFLDKRGAEYDTISFDAYCVAGRRLEGLNVKVRVNDEGDISCFLDSDDLENLQTVTKVKPQNLLKAAESYVSVCLAQNDFSDFTGEGTDRLIATAHYDNGAVFGHSEEKSEQMAVIETFVEQSRKIKC